jgi:hypothetical protein
MDFVHATFSRKGRRKKAISALTRVFDATNL